MTIWHWVRHGPTHEKAFVGWRDVPADLSDTAAIARLSAQLPDEALMISSDLKRCVATADALSARGRKRLAHDPQLREFNFGDWDGMVFNEVAARDPALSRAYWEDPGDVRAPNGESWNDAATRVNAVVDAMNAAHPEAHIIAVAHFGVILTQVQRARGQTPYEALGQKIEPLSLTRLTFERGRWAEEIVNHNP